MTSCHIVNTVNTILPPNSGLKRCIITIISFEINVLEGTRVPKYFSIKLTTPHYWQYKDQIYPFSVTSCLVYLITSSTVKGRRKVREVFIFTKTVISNPLMEKTSCVSSFINENPIKRILFYIKLHDKWFWIWMWRMYKMSEWKKSKNFYNDSRYPNLVQRKSNSCEIFFFFFSSNDKNGIKDFNREVPPSCFFNELQRIKLPVLLRSWGCMFS